MTAIPADLEGAHAFQHALARMCLHASDDGCAHGVEERPLPGAWLTYRRLVRARLQETVEHAFERLAQHLGAEAFCSLVAQFLATRGPRTRLLRLVPGEFLEFLATRADTLPSWALDLARFEWIELEVAYELDDPSGPSVDTVLAGPVIASRAVRLLDVAHRVHLLPREGPLESIGAGPATLCIYRDPTSFDTRVLELNDSAASIVRAARRPGGITIDEAARAAAATTPGRIDASWLDAFSTLIVDLGTRGILLSASAGDGDGSESRAASTA